MEIPKFKVVESASVEIIPWEVGRRKGPRKYDFLLDAVEQLAPGQCVVIEVPESLIKQHEKAVAKVKAEPRWDFIAPAKRAAMRQFSQMLQATLRRYVLKSKR